MARIDDQSIDELMRLVARRMEATDNDLTYQDERLLLWLANDLRLGLSRAERSSDDRHAEDFARRTLSRIAARRAEKALPRRPLQQRAAEISATVAQSFAAASRERCVTMLDMAVAAGEGREIWDEPCDRWLELPDDVPSGRYVALRVAGDSMAPVLEPRDVILIQLDATPRIDDVIVARLPDQGHVVKRVASIREDQIELASFNPGYDPIFISRDRSSVVGTVIARFTRE
jgi:phage repressor protein C with HTH and peptisase S24 domain